MTFVTEMPTAGSIVPALVMPPVKGRAGDRNGGAGGNDRAGAVDQDAVARRDDIAAVDDRAVKGYTGDGDAGFVRDRAAVVDIAVDRSIRRVDVDAGRVSEPVIVPELVTPPFTV